MRWLPGGMCARLSDGRYKDVTLRPFRKMEAIPESFIPA